MKNTATLGVLDFVKRQTEKSPYNYFDGTWSELVHMINEEWERCTVSPHNSSVLLFSVPKAFVSRFYTSLIPVDPELPLEAVFKARTSEESPFIQVTTPKGEKRRAQRVEIILYSHEVLEKDGDAPEVREADYYIVAINAYATEDPEPMRPMTMARNFLGLTGGTEPEVPYTAEEFARSIVFWSQHVRLSK